MNTLGYEIMTKFRCECLQKYQSAGLSPEDKLTGSKITICCMRPFLRMHEGGSTHPKQETNNRPRQGEHCKAIFPTLQTNELVEGMGLCMRGYSQKQKRLKDGYINKDHPWVTHHRNCKPEVHFLVCWQCNRLTTVSFRVSKLAEPLPES